MAEYIDREAVFHAMKMDVRPPFAVVRDFPAADVAPVVHSRWVQIGNTQEHYCAECGESFDLYAYCKEKYKLCPNCGARMDGEQK